MIDRLQMWIEEHVVETAVVFLGLTLMWLILFAPFAVAVQAQNIDACEAIGKAGDRIIYRCVDEEKGTLVYANDLGFMFVLE